MKKTKRGRVWPIKKTILFRFDVSTGSEKFSKPELWVRSDVLECGDEPQYGPEGIVKGLCLVRPLEADVPLRRDELVALLVHERGTNIFLFF